MADRLLNSIARLFRKASVMRRGNLIRDSRTHPDDLMVSSRADPS
jgi:hypothetical protein